MEENNKEWPLTDYGSSAIKVSELIKQLQKMMDRWGDLPVYCAVDYDYACSVEYLNADSVKYLNKPWSGEQIRINN